MTKDRNLAIQAGWRMGRSGRATSLPPRTKPEGKFILIRIPELDLVTEAPTQGRGRGYRQGLDRGLARRSDSFHVTSRTPRASHAYCARTAFGLLP